MYYLNETKNEPPHDSITSNVEFSLTSANDYSDKVIKSEGNKIWFYDGIRTYTALKLIQELKKLEINSLTHSITFNADPYPIYLYIHSPGGSVTASFDVASTIMSMRVPVYTVVDSFAASGGTIISMSGTKRFIRKTSYMMIHQLSGWFGGTYENMKDNMKNADLMMKDIVSFYKEKSKLPEKEIKKILKHDLLFDTETCLKYGLVDEVL